MILKLYYEKAGISLIGKTDAGAPEWKRIVTLGRDGVLGIHQNSGFPDFVFSKSQNAALIRN